jgi:hypothetical protein
MLRFHHLTDQRRWQWSDATEVREAGVRCVLHCCVHDEVHVFFESINTHQNSEMIRHIQC